MAFVVSHSASEKTDFQKDNTLTRHRVVKALNIYYTALRDMIEVTVLVVICGIDVLLGLANFPVDILNNPKS